MTVEELYGQMVDTFQRETGLALAGDGDMAVRLYAVAAQLYALYVQADWVGRQCFPQTAQGDYLDKHAQLRGLERRAATAAVGVLSFETDHPPEADLSIPEGTVCMTAAQVRFETTEAGVLKAGQTSAQVRARAVEPGAAGNAAAGTVRAMAVAPVGVSRCTNPEAFSGGLDAEGDESLRERVLETFRRMPNGANAAFYQQEALSFPEVAAATVVARPRGVGTVDVFLATAAGLPDSGLLEQVAAHLEERREIAVDVQVKAPEVRTVDVSVQVAARPGADFDTVRQAVESAVRGWFDGRLLGQSVLRAQLGALIFGVEGVENYALTAPAEVLVLPMTEDLAPAISLATGLREKGIAAQLYHENKKFKQKLAYADRLGAPFVALLGEDELAAGKVALKDMTTGEQRLLSPAEAADHIHAALASRRAAPPIQEKTHA